jgi:hypothetical protein
MINYEYSEEARPPHKRTEGRAPVWGSEFTTKAATQQGGGVQQKSCPDFVYVGLGMAISIT